MDEQDFEKLWMAYRISPDEAKVAFRKAMQEIRNQALEDAAKVCDQFDDEAIAKMEQTNNPLQGMKANGCRKCGLAIRHLISN